MGGLTLEQLFKFNPSIKADCTALAIGTYYCISIWPNGDGPPDDGDGGSNPTTTGIHTPSPIQTGMVTNCDKFYKVQPGDPCPDIAKNNSIALSDFYAWNPAVGADCRGLQADVYVCVHASGPSTPTTTGGTGVATPSPTQPGMVSGCNRFYKVQSGDGCDKIAQDNHISRSDFNSWNPSVKSDCTGLLADVYVCIARDSSAVPTTTKPGNGVATPTPTQPGMVSGCSNFYKVKSGDGCDKIAQDNHISRNDFNSWNPSVKNDCTGLLADVYVCVARDGSAAPTTTNSGNGVATPTPTQSGVTGRCNRFYKVKSGDGCWQIAHDANINLDDFYSWNPAVRNDCTGLQAEVYVCTGVF